MGQDIVQDEFTNAEFKAFHERLRAETALLKTWFDEDVFSKDAFMAGSELEAWLIDEHCQPAARNDDLLSHLNDPLVVPELSQFNVEFNAEPVVLQGAALSRMERELDTTWTRALERAAEIGIGLVAIGILPTVRDDQLIVTNMSTAPRYKALNDQVFQLRRGYPITLEIAGKDKLESVHEDVMLEAGTTSFQIHLKVPAAEAANYYNVSKILAAPTLAVACNSPYLFGHDLWDETRIPLFEQGVSMGRWNYAQRVSFGLGYLEESLYEVFQANRQRYPVLLPMQFDTAPSEMKHVLLHNSTIWRWAKAILGFDNDGTPHVRIEHRVIPAGPTITDQIANAAFYIGLAHRLAPEMDTLRWQMPFADARENFYAAARNGLVAKVRWMGGDESPISELVLEKLLPLAADGLRTMELDIDDIEHYLGIIEARVRTGQNGTCWQRAWVRKYEADMAALLRAYCERQATGRPVHEWNV